MEIEKKHILVLGAGRSGLAAIDFILAKGGRVALYDGSDAEKPVYAELRERGCAVFAGAAPEELDFDFAVISPGIPLTDPCAKALRAAKIPLWGELEFASRFITAPIIGITGTNGKTTTTTLMGEVLKAAGYDVFVGGNIGVPLMASLDREYDYYVVEMSSFQLETIETLDAFISIYLNLTPDHLDRHGSLEGYLDAKARLIEKQGREHCAVLNYDDPAIRSLKDRTEAKVYFFHRGTDVMLQGSYLTKDKKTVRYRGMEFFKAEDIIATDEIRIPGPHNLENAMAVITAARMIGVEQAVIESVLQSFPGVEHRLEDAGTHKGVRYVNDSKATNPDSVLKALASYDEAPILLIAGGRNKGNSFDPLGEVIAARCRELILIGEAAEDMAASARKAGMKEEAIHLVADMAAAVALSSSLARSGDVVLLSPANASFDQFSCFEERGEVFKEAVANLK